jgi:predicted DNA-binding transcriptional regulator AlpA
MTIAEAADRLGLGKKRVYQLVKKTFPRKRKVFGIFTFSEAEVEELGKHSRSWVLQHCSSSELSVGRVVVDTRGGGEG